MAATGILAQFQDMLNQGEFRIQRCVACAKHIYFPREICPHCGAADPAWVTPSGHGPVYSVTTVRRKSDAGGDYNVSLLDLDEGVTASIERTLETGLGVLATLAVGHEAFDLETIDRLKELESLAAFEIDRFGRER